MIQTVTDRRRIMIVAIICVLVINIVMPVRRAEAVAPVIVAGAAVGTFVGVVAIGAIAMDVMGYKEQSADTMAFAQATWMASEQWVKDQVMASYNAAVAAGDKTMAISADVRDWFIEHASPLVSVSGGVAKKIDVGEVSLGNGESVSFPYQMYGLSLESNQTSDVYYVSGGYTNSIALYYSSQWAIDNGSSLTRIAFGSNFLGLPTPYAKDSGIRWLSQKLLIPVTTDPVRARSLVLTHAGSVLRMTRADALGLRDKRDALRDSFPAAIPVPQPNDFVYTPVNNPGVDVYQKGDQLVDDAGKVYTPYDVDVKVAPKTQVVTDAAGNPAVDANGKPIVAVPVGATQVGAPAIPGDLVNVRTGEKVTTGDTTANPPLDWASQPTTSINWAPLKMTGAALTRVFPFSIPWDVAAQLQIFNVKPEIPVIHVDVPRFWVAGDFVWHLKFDIDFTMFDPVAIGIRWIGNIAFTIGLALAMRRFMPQ